MENSRVHVLVCHTNRILSDCLCFTLQQLGSYVCHVSDDSFHFKTLSSSDFVADVLIMDARLELGLATRVVETVRRESRDCRLLFLVSGGLQKSLSELASLGADGCITEDASLELLQEAIETLLDGGSYCSPQVANELFLHVGRFNKQEKWLEHLDKVRLTPREREVLELIAWERLGNKQIAKRLCISLYTVKNHVHNIIEKLGVVDRHEAAELATKQRMLLTVRN